MLVHTGVRCTSVCVGCLAARTASCGGCAAAGGAPDAEEQARRATGMKSVVSEVARPSAKKAAAALSAIRRAVFLALGGGAASVAFRPRALIVAGQTACVWLDTRHEGLEAVGQSAGAGG